MFGPAPMMIARPEGAMLTFSTIYEQDSFEQKCRQKPNVKNKILYIGR